MTNENVNVDIVITKVIMSGARINGLFVGNIVTTVMPGDSATARPTMQ